MPRYTCYDASYGITPEHWMIFCKVAAEHDLILFVRGGKQVSIPWIKEKFPAKPLDFKSKVDERTGFLYVKSEEEKQVVHRAGHWYLIHNPARPVPAAAGGSPPAKNTVYVPVGPSGVVPGVTFDSRTDGHWWAALSTVVHSSLRLPFTSDYDLAAVVGTEDCDYMRTFMSISPEVLPPGTKDMNNLWTKGVADLLNARFDDVRIMHGTQCQYDGALINNPGEDILMFMSDGRVLAMHFTSSGATSMFLRYQMIKYNPNLIYTFNN